MFTYGLWDRQQHQLFLARDRFGIKPLYYCDTGSTLIFASTARAVAAIRGDATLDQEAVSRPTSAADRCRVHRAIFDGIRRAGTGNTLTWSAERGSRTRRYWWFDQPEGGLAPPVASTDLPGVLGDSVAAHTISNGPLRCS